MSTTATLRQKRTNGSTTTALQAFQDLLLFTINLVDPSVVRSLKIASSFSSTTTTPGLFLRLNLRELFLWIHFGMEASRTLRTRMLPEPPALQTVARTPLPNASEP